MKELFYRYAREVGIRYAVHMMKYERVTYSLLQLWCKQGNITISEEELRKHYNSGTVPALQHKELDYTQMKGYHHG